MTRVTPIFVCLAKSLLVQSDHTILEASHANLLSRFMEGLQMGWSNDPTLVVQFPISTSSRLTDLAGPHAWMVENTPHPHPLGVQVLVEKKVECCRWRLKASKHRSTQGGGMF